MNADNIMSNNGWSKQSIAYCSNVHAGENLDEITNNIKQFIRPVREQRSLTEMTIGLWLSAEAAVELKTEDKLRKFKHTLSSSGLTLTSINGFPFGGFHKEQVKADVYLPDWSQQARLDYTKNLADILADCLPDDVSYGAISTLPLGYKARWSEAKQKTANQNIKSLSHHLAQLYERTGKQIMVCFEMEPDCVLESSKELIDYFTQEIQPKKFNNKFIGICYDVCHQAVMHEDIKTSLKLITQADINIGKIQLSNALQVDLNTVEKNQTLDFLREFSEPRYLHQVKTRDQSGQLKTSPDLAAALQSINDREPLPQENPWRIHFHVPLNAATLLHQSLSTTQKALEEVFDFLHEYSDIRPYLEVETYSWHVMPESLQPKNEIQLITGITKELNWVEKELNKRNLLSAHT